MAVKDYNISKKALDAWRTQITTALQQFIDNPDFCTYYYVVTQLLQYEDVAFGGGTKALTPGAPEVDIYTTLQGLSADVVCNPHDIKTQLTRVNILNTLEEEALTSVFDRIYLSTPLIHTFFRTATDFLNKQVDLYCSDIVEETCNANGVYDVNVIERVRKVLPTNATKESIEYALNALGYHVLV